MTGARTRLVRRGRVAAAVVACAAAAAVPVPVPDVSAGATGRRAAPMAAAGLPWLDRVEAASPVKTDIGARNYQYVSVGGGGTVLMPGPDGFTGLKPASAPYAPVLTHEELWNRNTRRIAPFRLVGGSTDGTAFRPLAQPDITAMHQRFDLRRMTLTSRLDLQGAACTVAPCTTTRTTFVTPEGVIVVRIDDTVPGRFALRIAPDAGGTPTHAVTTVNGVPVGLRTTVQRATTDATAFDPAGLGVAAQGTAVTYDAATGVVAGAVGPGVPLVLAIAVEGPAGAAPAADPAASALAAARAAGTFAEAAARTVRDWESFWLESEISIPDQRLERRYVLSAAIQAAHMRGVRIPTGMNGFRDSIYFGGQGLEYDLAFNHMSMLAANHASTTRHIADWIIGCMPKAREIAERYNPRDEPDAGAKFPWIASWDCGQTAWASNTQLFDTEAFPSVNAMRMALHQATAQDDRALLADVLSAMGEVAQYQLNNAQLEPDPDGGPHEKLINQGFFYQWPPRYLQITEGAVTEQTGLAWLMRTMAEYDIAPGATYEHHVYIPTGDDPVERGRVVNGYPGAPTGGPHAVSPMRLPFFFTGTIAPDDPLAYPTYSMTSAQHDINYTFNNGWAAVNAADMHLGDQARAHLLQMIDQSDREPAADEIVLHDDLNFKESYATGAETTPEVGADGTFMLGVQHMLLGEVSTRHRSEASASRTSVEIFPALPGEWERAGASFARLRTNDGLLVSGDYSESRVTATVTNTTGAPTTKVVRLRVPSDALAVTEVNGRRVEAVVEGRFASTTVTIPAGATVTLTVVPSSRGTWTTIDDADPSLAYSTGWSTVGVPATYHLGTGHHSTTAGATVTIPFEGQAIRLLGERTELGGHLRVTIDGRELPGLRETYAVVRRQQQVLFEASGLAPGPHVLRVEVAGRRAAYSGATFVTVDAVQVLRSELRTTAVPAAEAGFAAPGWSAGAHGATASAVATASVTFTGSGIRLRGSMGPDTGRVRVRLDAGPPVEIDTWSWSRRSDAVLWELGGLAHATHVLQVEALGSNGPRSTGPTVTVSGVDVIRVPAERRCVPATAAVTPSSQTPYPAWAPANLRDGVVTSTASSLGWHSALGIRTADAGECVVVDRGASSPVTAVTLHRADPLNGPGLAFPLDYRVDVSDDPAFSTFTTVVTVAGAAVPPSGSVVHAPATAVGGRYVRLVATRLRPIWGGQYAVALAELAVR